jgi:hypothetical protein
MSQLTCSYPICYPQKASDQGIPSWVAQLAKEVSSDRVVVENLYEAKGTVRS